MSKHSPHAEELTEAVRAGLPTSIADLSKHVDVLVAEARRLGVAPATLTAMITKAYS